MQLDRLVHVYRMPLDFSDAKECCLFLCDCPRMDCAWNLLDHMDTSAMSSVDTLAKLDFCIHSTAIRALHDTGFIPYSSMASREVCSRLTDFDFSCDKQPVCLIQSSPSLLLSCDFGNGQPCEGRSRVFIRTNQQRRYVCGSCCGTAASNCKLHLGPFSSWLAAVTDEGLGDVFESYTFKSSNQPPPAVGEDSTS